MNRITNSTPENGSSKRNRSVLAILLCIFLVVGISIIVKSFLFHPVTTVEVAPPVEAKSKVKNVAASSTPIEAKAKTTIAALPIVTTNQPVVTPVALKTSQQLVAGLLEIATHNPVSKEQAEQFKQMLTELINQGEASVPSIRDFLAKNSDSDFLQIDGGDQLSYATLRASMIDALKQIGGPEAQALMRDTLQTTGSAGELLMLSQNLDQLAPGLYRDDIVKAANEVLQMAAENKLGENVEVGPAMRILNAYGTADMADDAPKNVATKLNDALALANLPDNAGLPSLIEVAQNSKSDPTEQALASQMIAQLAGQNDTALKSLIEMAGNQQIPNSLWQKIAPILGGNEFQPGNVNAGADGAKYSVVNNTTTPAQINQRISMIDMFLGVVAQDSSAAAALKQQRNALAAKLTN